MHASDQPLAPTQVPPQPHPPAGPAGGGRVESPSVHAVSVPPATEAGEGSQPEAPWWFGEFTDHLFEQCPLRRRSLPHLARHGHDRQGDGTVDPLGTDICGWCRRVWTARNRTEA